MEKIVHKLMYYSKATFFLLIFLFPLFKNFFQSMIEIYHRDAFNIGAPVLSGIEPNQMIYRFLLNIWQYSNLTENRIFLFFILCSIFKLYTDFIDKSIKTNA